MSILRKNSATKITQDRNISESPRKPPSSIPQLEVISNENREENFIVNNFKEFLQSCSLHGLKYLADDKLSFLERLDFRFLFIILIMNLKL